MFQSLFRWITFPDCSFPQRGHSPRAVSILVPLDHLPRHLYFIIRHIRISKFQSLFRWITFPDLTVMLTPGGAGGTFQSLFRWITFPDPSAPRGERPRTRGFNPCSAGSPSPTPKRHAGHTRVRGVQSLFRWITFPDTWEEAARADLGD